MLYEVITYLVHILVEPVQRVVDLDDIIVVFVIVIVIVIGVFIFWCCFFLALLGQISPRRTVRSKNRSANTNDRESYNFV